MGIEFQTKKLEHGIVHEFCFNENINKYIIGIKSYSVYFINYHYHYFKTLGLNIEVSGIIRNKLRLTPRLSLDDNSGNHLNPSSYVEVCVIAWTGTGHEHIQTVSNQKFPFFLECSDRVVNSGCILSGFDLFYPNGDFKTYHVHAGTSMDIAQMQYVGSGNAELYDISRRRATCQWVKGSMFADCDESSNLYVQSFSDLRHGSRTLSVPTNLASFCIVLTSFTIATGRDSAEQGIKCTVNISEWKNSQVKLNCELMFPNNNHSGNSNVSGLLIGTLKR